MEESAKSRARREAEGFFDKYCRGKGIDIGSGPDPLTPACRAWDVKDGDAQKMEGVADESFDFVYSSHCLEHMRDPLEALLNWWRILKPGGHLIVVVPHEDLYEQGLFPSVFNSDHKTSFSISKQRSWSPVHYNLTDLVRHLPRHDVVYMRVIDQHYDYAQLGGMVDQTMGKAEAAIAKMGEAVRLEPSNAEYRIALATLRASTTDDLMRKAEGARREGRAHRRGAALRLRLRPGCGKGPPAGGTGFRRAGCGIPRGSTTALAAHAGAAPRRSRVPPPTSAWRNRPRRGAPRRRRGGAHLPP